MWWPKQIQQDRKLRKYLDLSLTITLYPGQLKIHSHEPTLEENYENDHLRIMYDKDTKLQTHHNFYSTNIKMPSLRSLARFHRIERKLSWTSKHRVNTIKVFYYDIKI